MTIEITDSLSIESDYQTTQSDPINQVKKGLTSIPDTLEIAPQAPKPPFHKRIFYGVGLIAAHIATMVIRLFYWISRAISGPSHERKLYHELNHHAKNKDLESTRVFLLNHANKDLSAGYLFNDFLKMPEIHPYLEDILNGASVSLLNDQGHFFRRWKIHPESYQRISSHKYQDDECYAIGHFLFWLDYSGQTRFQFENSPLRGLFSSMEHLIDYLRYKRDNEQQGISGTSPFTEDYGLSFTLNPENFLLP